MVMLAEPNTTNRSRISAKRVVEIWDSLPENYAEADLGANLVSKIFEHLTESFEQVKLTPSIGKSGRGLIPDYLIYQDITKPPVIVVEIKKRTSPLVRISNELFVEACEQNTLYQQAIGTGGGNGILQYLDVTKVNPGFLASYGLVFNGDFFQLWRRVDGLIIPMTKIERVTKSNLPKLLKKLASCLQTPPTALVTAIWNRKGGVAKTTNTINIAACLALAGKKVLLVDLDTQNDLTTGIGLDPNYQPDYFEKAYDKMQLKEIDAARGIILSAIQTKQYPTSSRNKFNLSILSSNKKYLDDINNKNFPHSTATIFNYILSLIRHKYDYIFIDSSPKDDKLTRCLLSSADAIVLPVDIGAKALNHAIDLSNRIIPEVYGLRDGIDGVNIGPFNLGLLFSNCSNPIGENVQKSIDNMIDQKFYTGKKINTKLINYAQTKQAEFQSVPVICWENSQITKLFQELTKELFLGHNYIIK
jgi:chromosome partitioning protein